jgi:hypothetical protein
MQQGPSYDTNNSLLIQEICNILGTRISSTCSQKPATFIHPEPDQSSPSSPILFLEDQCQYPPSPPTTSKRSLSKILSPPPKKSLYAFFLLRRSCHMAFPSHPWFDHPNIISWWVQIMKFRVTTFPQPPLTSSALDPNISSVPHSRNLSIYILLLMWQTNLHTRIKQVIFYSSYS